MAAQRSFWRTAARIGGALLSAYGAGAAAAAPPPGASPPPPPAAIVSPPARGFEPQYSTPRERALQTAVQTYEALLGRTATRLGPSNPRWSTFTGELTPENITSAIELANTGFPYQFQDMCRRQVENDPHAGACIDLALSGIVSKEDRLEPPPTLRRDKLAISTANWLRAVREQIDGFNGSRYALLWAEGMGYAAAENVYDHRTITWFTADNERITRQYLLPAKLEIVDGRGFRFDTETDEPLLWLQGGYVSLPPAKFVFHEAYRLSSIRERGGFMRGVIWPSAGKLWDVRDMMIFLHMYGLPQLIAEYDPKQYKYPEAMALARDLMELWGQGAMITTAIDAFRVRNDGPPPSGALVHRDAAQFFNEEITKRVLGAGPLMMSSGGGNYGLGDVHDDGTFNGQVLRAGALCESLRKHLWAPTLAMNALRLGMDLGAWPAEIMAVLPAYHARLLKQDTPEARQKVFSQAMRDGLPMSRTQYRGELHLDEPKDEGDLLKGEGVSVPSSGKVVGGVDASEGAEAPALPGSPATGPAAPPRGDQDGPASIDLTATAQAAVITVNEARRQMNLPPWGDADGELSVSEFMAKHSTVISDAAGAEKGAGAQESA